jgi:cell wall-associated NlpC family hydrolase
MATQQKYSLISGIRQTAVLLTAFWFCMPSEATEWMEPQPSSAFSMFHALTQRASEVAMRAMGLVGIPYKYGGNSPENGMDCSGLVRYVFQEAWGT